MSLVLVFGRPCGSIRRWAREEDDGVRGRGSKRRRRASGDRKRRSLHPRGRFDRLTGADAGSDSTEGSSLSRDCRLRFNDLFREARAAGIGLDRVRVLVRGDFSGDPAVSSEVEYDVDLEGNAPRDQLEALIERVDEIAEIPNSLRRGTAVRLGTARARTAVSKYASAPRRLPSPDVKRHSRSLAQASSLRHRYCLWHI